MLISLISLKLTNETLIKIYLHVVDFFSFAIAQVIFKNLTRHLFDIFIIIFTFFSVEKILLLSSSVFYISK